MIGKAVAYSFFFFLTDVALELYILLHLILNEENQDRNVFCSSVRLIVFNSCTVLKKINVLMQTWQVFFFFKPLTAY